MHSMATQRPDLVITIMQPRLIPILMEDFMAKSLNAMVRSIHNHKPVVSVRP